MPLHPKCRFVLDLLAASNDKPLHQMSVAEARTSRALRQPAVIELAGPAEEVAHVEDRILELPSSQVPVRIYRPSSEPNLPALIFFHGGGWVLGNLDLMDRPCRSLANQSGCVVVSVDYRLAPDHKFPAAVDDAYGATVWVAHHAGELGIDPRRIAVGGDSAGGNLAAAVTLKARDQGGPHIAFQLLIYPVVDYRDDRPSAAEFAEGHMLTRAGMQWFWGHYLNHESEGLNPLASPMDAETLANLPPALIITAECDPLRDQGEAYAQRLAESGNAVELKRYEGAIHAFFQMGAVIDTGRAAIADAAQALRSALFTV